MGRMESPEENYERVSVRLSGQRLERFEAHLEESGDSKSEVIRSGIDAVTSGRTETPDHMPLSPPVEEQLAWAYDRLCKAATRDGVIPGKTARRVCSGGPDNISKSEARTLILQPLTDRSYLRESGNIYGDESYKLNGWDR